VRGDKGTIPPPVFEASIVKSKLYHLPSSARDVDENLPCLGGFFLKGRDYLLNIARRLATYALMIASMPPVGRRAISALLNSSIRMRLHYRRLPPSSRSRSNRLVRSSKYAFLA